jgi:hypothetical protein
MNDKMELAGTVRVGPLRTLNYCGKDLWDCSRPEAHSLCVSAITDIAEILEINGYAQEAEILAKAVSRI